METSPLAYTQAEQKIVERFFSIAGKRKQIEIAELQASEKAVRTTILPLIAQLEGDALLDLFAWLEVVATKTNAARIANHPQRRAADGAAIEKRKVAFVTARAAKRDGAAQVAHAEASGRVGTE